MILSRLVDKIKGSTSVSYSYDTSGQRISKTVGNLQYTYLYQNGLLLQETRGNRIIDYSYDSNGRPCALRYKNGDNDPVYYYYKLNSRGDVIGLYKANGTLQYKYEYDVWGNILSVKNASGVEVTSSPNIANLQSLKYRGYVYDYESGLYYLQSRYYDPVTHRFLNADGLVSTGTGILGYNMFAYCENYPVKYCDKDGEKVYPSDFIGPLRPIDYRLPSFNSVKSGKAICFNPINKYASLYYVDITKQLDTELVNNCFDLIIYQNNYSFLESAVHFFNKAKPGGDWDFKSQTSWHLESHVKYRYHSFIFRYDDLGNVNYGFTGRVLFTEETLKWGAGIAQIICGTSKLSYINTCFDDPRDQDVLMFGYNLWVVS